MKKHDGNKLRLARTRMRVLAGAQLDGVKGATGLPWSPFCVTPFPGGHSWECQSFRICVEN
jgi:hypothetical protein